MREIVEEKVLMGSSKWQTLSEKKALSCELSKYVAIEVAPELLR